MLWVLKRSVSMAQDNWLSKLEIDKTCRHTALRQYGDLNFKCQDLRNFGNFHL